MLNIQLLVILVSNIVFPIYGTNLHENNLEVRLYEVDARNSVLKTVETSANQDVILQGVERIRLECNAAFPVQWIYSGNGVPASSATIRKETEGKYSASVFITALKESHTGRYDCTTTGTPSNSAFLFLYVPGINIFTTTASENGPRRITIPNNDSKVLIPCGVSSPETPVILEKALGTDVLVAIKTLGVKPAYSFDPRNGFVLDTAHLQNPEGTYVCTAFGRGSKKTLEFDVRRNHAKASVVSTISPIREPASDNNGLRCSTHTDCPPNWACFTDLVCRDPCSYSIRCGTGASCKYNDRRPYCECPKDFVGDPMKECFNTVQGSDPRVEVFPTTSPRTTLAPSSHTGSQCKVNSHCPASTHICLNGNCLDACAVKICDRNAYCVTNAERVAKCHCSPGFLMQDGHACVPEKLQLQPSSRQREESQRSRTSFPIPQGCDHNRDCPANTICRIPSSGSSYCADICGSLGACGANAQCVNNFCSCKAPFEGDPFTACYAKVKVATTTEATNLLRHCSTHTDCAENQKCETLAGNVRKCIDACVTTRCPFNLECRALKHKAECVCPEGFTGSSVIGCTKAVDESCSFQRNRQRDRESFGNLQITSHPQPTSIKNVDINVCKKAGLDCGSNALCRSVEGKVTCMCQPNFVGQPPKCTSDQCTFNIECPENHSCVQNKCTCIQRDRCL